VDIAPVLQMIVAEFVAGGVTLGIPARPVLFDVDPDAFAILSRNLIENAR